VVLPSLGPAGALLPDIDAAAVQAEKVGLDAVWAGDHPAESSCRPSPSPVSQLNPGQQVLETQTIAAHPRAIRMAAFNTNASTDQRSGSTPATRANQ
jgi:alkanesulfonate monooxygenase SsuD/methylene tetrahydromethanopterin reductase-like flavin-dependent oxidoreductase (luciferase family)